MGIRKSSWTFSTSTSLAVSAYFVGAQKSSFVLTGDDGVDVTFNYAAAGAGVSWKTPTFGAARGTKQDWSAGDIFLNDQFFSPKDDLEVSDIEGACQVFDVGASFIGGLSGTVMALGIPTKRIPHQLWKISLIGMVTSAVTGSDVSDARALLMMTGVNGGSIGAGALASYGYVWANDHVRQIKFSPQASSDDGPSRATSPDLIYLPESVLFGFDRYDLQSEAYDILASLEWHLGFLKPSRISVEGHTDDIGTGSYNRGLSYQRAWTVAKWLISRKAFDAARISVIGFGHTRPIKPNRIGKADNEQGRATNRRVEVRLYW
jgi:outer membrane protein OmpA-like peptidoglycan-associated protein